MVTEKSLISYDFVTDDDNVVQADSNYGFCGYLLIFFSVLLLIVTFPFSLMCCLKVSVH